MAVETFADGYLTTLSAGISSGATTLVPTSTTGAPVANPTTDPPKQFRITIQGASYPTSGTREVLTVTDSRTGTWTVSATANAYSSGAVIAAVVSAGSLGKFLQSGGSNTITATTGSEVPLTIVGSTIGSGNLLAVTDYLGNVIFSVPPFGGPLIAGDNLRVGPDYVSQTAALGFDGTGQLAQGDAAGLVGGLAIGNTTAEPSAAPDGTHTLFGGATHPGLVLYSKAGRQFLVDGAGCKTEVGLPTFRRNIVVQKDGGGTGISTVGAPAATISGTGTATNNDNPFIAALVNCATGATNGNAYGISPAAYTQVQGAWSPMMWTRLGTDASSVTNVRIWDGLFSAAPDGIASPTGIHCAAFRYDTGVDGTAFWRCVTSAAGTPTVTTTSIAVAANTMYDLRIVWKYDGSAIYFMVNDVVVATHTTAIPTYNQPLAPAVRVTALSNASRAVQFSRYVLTHLG